MNLRIAAAALVLMLSACGRTWDTAGMTREQIEETAEQAMEESDYRAASRLFTELMFSYPGSDRMDYYLYRLGMAEAGNRYWADAIFYFSRVENEYSRSRWADNCSYETARVWWAQRQDYRKDLTPVMNCREQLQRFFDRYPGSALVAEAAELLHNVNTYLARRALFVGRFYARREKYDASLLYLREALNDYGEHDLMPEVLVALGDVYARRGNRFTAREYYRRAIDEYELDRDRLAEVQSKLDEL